MKRVLVVGGGPAGLAAAISAARAGARVTLLERNSQCGRKLLITGGGHCNLSNLKPAAEWPALFGKHGRFITPAMDHLPLEKLREWCADIGVPLASVDGFHLFPSSGSARDVRDGLLGQAIEHGVNVVYTCRVENLRLIDNTFEITAHNAGWRSDSVILATGGKSYPALGSTGDGFHLASAMGHAIRPLVPGLVGLRADNLSPDLAGLVLPDAAVSFKVRGRKSMTDRRELLLTHTGVSGPAVLDLSGSVAEEVEQEGEASLTVRWCGDMGPAQWKDQFARWRQLRGATPVAALLHERLPKRLTRWLCVMAGLKECTGAAAIRAEQRDGLAALLGAFPVHIIGSEGWDKAMITSGGVATGGIHPSTLESRAVKGLFFSGEVIDIDGPCGGYNLHWALASGALAGFTAATA